MQPAPADPARPEGRITPYRWASPGRHAQAVLWVAEQLHDYFPSLSVTAFAQAFHALRPDVWEDRTGCWVEYADLVRLTRQLAVSPLVPDLNLPLCAADTFQLAEALDYFHREATALFVETKAGCQIQSRRLGSLLQQLAIGNPVVERVLRGTRSQAVAHDPPAAADFAV